MLSLYEDVNQVNRSFVKRLTTFVEKDASLNAVVLLNCFGTATQRFITHERFAKVETTFAAYFKDGVDGTPAPRPNAVVTE
jgi:hypothetical protein